MLPQSFAYITILISFVGGYLYIRDTIRGITKPNRVSWFFWAVAPLIGVYISHKSGVSIPILISTFMAGFIPALVVIASFFNKNSYWRTTSFDIICGILSLAAIIIWVTTKNPFISISFAILGDLFAGIPTIIKSYKHSDSENIFPYTAGILNTIITILIIKEFSFENTGFPIYIMLLNLVIIIGVLRNKKTI
jgi:hypothetical protein